MNTFEKIYYFHNKNNYINEFSSKSILDIFHEILYNIDYTLTILLQSGVQVNLNDLNFDNLICLEVIDNKEKPVPFIINMYKFSLKDKAFMDMDDKPMYFISKYPSLGLIFKSIIDRMDKFNQTKDHKPKTSKSVTNINNKKNVGVKDLIKETSNILNNISGGKSVEPDIIRPMNSVLYEVNEKDNKKNIIDNLDTESLEDLDPDELKKIIDNLQNIKEKEKQKIDELKVKTEMDLENYSKMCNDLGDKKRDMRRKLEREKEKRNKFDANKYAYKKIKQDILDGKLTEDKISELFINEYPIYKFLDENCIIDKEDEYIIYTQLYDELYNSDKVNQPKNEPYIPHNVHYLSSDEQDKYKAVVNNNKDIIDDFIKKNTDNKNKKYPPLEEILNNLDSDEPELDNIDNINFENVQNEIKDNENFINEEQLTNDESEKINDKINKIEKVLLNELSTD